MVQAPAKPTPAPPSDFTLSADLVEAPPITLRLPSQWTLTDERVVELGEANDALGFERTAEGVLQINFPPGFPSSEAEGTVGAQIIVWRFAHDTGRTTPSSGGYSLPDGALLIPDAAWISDERLAGVVISPTKPLRAVPDFVLEVRSHSQRIGLQQRKMQQWMANGVRLGWLIDPFNALVWIYREGQEEPELLKRPDTLSGEDVMVGLTVDLTHVWRANKGGGD